jgi:hypothetical protein
LDATTLQHLMVVEKVAVRHDKRINDLQDQGNPKLSHCPFWKNVFNLGDDGSSLVEQVDMISSVAACAMAQNS